MAGGGHQVIADWMFRLRNNEQAAVALGLLAQRAAYLNPWDERRQNQPRYLMVWV